MERGFINAWVGEEMVHKGSCSNLGFYQVRKG